LGKKTTYEGKKDRKEKPQQKTKRSTEKQRGKDFETNFRGKHPRNE
jgi:hypothetical protein